MRFLFLLLLLLPISLAAQPTTPQARYEAAYYAWDAGDYPEALETLIALLESADGDPLLKAIALLTGEWQITTEITTDGRTVRWHPNGQEFAYESGTAPNVQTHVVGIDGTRRASVAGYSLVFNPDGPEAAFLQIEETPDLAALRAEVDSLLQARNFQTFVQRRAVLQRREAEQARLMRLDLRTGQARPIEATMSKTELAWGAGGALYVLSAPAEGASQRALHRLQPGGAPDQVADLPAAATGLRASPDGRRLVLSTGRNTIVLLDPATGTTQEYTGLNPVFSADGSRLAFVGESGEDNAVFLVNLNASPEALEALTTPQPINAPALSPDGSRLAFQAMPREDWDIYIADFGAESSRQLTRDIQHDLFPQFLTGDRLLAVMGEARHRRAYLYNLNTDERERLFHNNTIRTVAPQYEWVPSPDGQRVLIVAERDGDTVSPERGVYLTDLTQTVSKADLLARLRVQLAAEQDLRARGEAMFTPIAENVRAVLENVSVGRIYNYERDLFQFDSKYITEPGNQKAIEYLAAKLRAFGYEPELQWFEPRQNARTANVIATLRGTTDPDLIYVASSHFDSVQRGPGADDNTSGTAALLEAARVMANHPQGATIQFAFFTGEEAGLLGSREFIRIAQERGDRIVGALNNDMIGYANDHRLDNTIRYSNPGLRDVQHAAALGFTDLILYDAKYYKSTDAQAYYDAYGDIVAGIGSYPILGNPHYHQPHDVLETINHQLVAEVSKTTAATLMLMASSPSRLTGLTVQREGTGYSATWQPAVEQTITGYRVTYGPADDPARHTLTASTPQTRLPEAMPGWVVRVKTVNPAGMESWDWATAAVE